MRSLLAIAGLALVCAAWPIRAAQAPDAVPGQAPGSESARPATESQPGDRAPASREGATATEPRPAFSDWLAEVRSEAIARGIRAEVIDQAFADVEEPLPVILERDRAQAETVLPLETYLRRRVTAKAIRTGREESARYHAILEQVGSRYGVSPQVIVAIWGLESSFGQFSGTRPIIAALTTLAWDPRRASFFRGELFNALEILNRGDIDLAHMRGSWAGAMGQPQFMPSSYLQYAQDFDGDGRRDIWSSPADIFASIAEYLRGHGWEGGQAWGREVRLSKDVARRVSADVPHRAGTCKAMGEMTIALPTREWAKMGVRPVSGTLLSSASASLISGSTSHYLVYGNYDAILGYNCANAYALSVGVLADRIGTAAASKATTKGPARRPAARKKR
jgi:membrane-bound lytic murein transglycosylase B